MSQYGTSMKQKTTACADYHHSGALFRDARDTAQSPVTPFSHVQMGMSREGAEARRIVDHGSFRRGSLTVA